MINFVKPELWMIQAIAKNMRKADAEEVWASHRHTPLESLLKGWETSDFATVAMSRGVPLVVFGLVKRDVLSGTGIIWMLGADQSMKYRREFFKQTPPVIEEMLTICPRLCNMVYSKNTASIQWLKCLGFTIDDPVPFGPADELFHRFHKERSL